MSRVLLDSLRLRSKGNYNLVREEKSAMWYIILSRSLPEKQKSQKQNYEEHRQWLDDQHRAGRLLFSGPTADRAYGIYIMLASSKSEAKRIAAQDPHHVRGIRSMEVCCTKVIMSGVNGNVIMSGWRDDNPDDERREAARGYTKSI